MSPTLHDEDLRRRLFDAHAIRSYRRRRRISKTLFMERVVLTGLCIFYLFFFGGLIWNLIIAL
jgi:hypothetical protein